MRVFLSHSAKDKLFVRTLAAQLRTYDIRVWIDEAELDVGDSLIQRISEGVADCDFIIAVISRHSVDSNWVQKELLWAMTKEINGQRVVVLPILLDHCDLPYFLRDKLYADYRELKQHDSQFKLLLRALMRHSGRRNRVQTLANSGVLGEAETHESIGDANVGELIRGGESGFFGYRAARHEMRLFWVLGASGGVLIVAAFILRFNAAFLNLHWSLVRLASLLVTCGALFAMSSTLFHQAFDSDKLLLVKIEKIGGHWIPFGLAWRKQFTAGRHNRRYRWALFVEAVAFYLFCCRSSDSLLEQWQAGDCSCCRFSHRPNRPPLTRFC